MHGIILAGKDALFRKAGISMANQIPNQRKPQNNRTDGTVFRPLPDNAVPSHGGHGKPQAVKSKPPVKKPLIPRTDPIVQPDMIIKRGNIDRPLLVILIILLCFGSVMVFSASYSSALSEKGNSYYYILRHLGFIAFGSVIMMGEIVVFKNGYQWIRKITPFIYLAGLAMLAFVLVYGVALGVARRWIYIGSFSIQPSEIMKFALILTLAAYYAKYQTRILSPKFLYSSLWGDLYPFLLVAVPCGLIALENHLSGTIIVFVIGMTVIFAAGSRKIWFLVAAVLAIALFIVAVTCIPYVQKRFDAFLHPENYDSNKETWQTDQGLIAVGSGGWLGVGLGNSRQKHQFVSQPQNDFIFAIVCEELGFVGALCVILLFILFIIRGFTIALRAPDTFSTLTAIGITTQLGLQAILNMMVVTDIIPNTGISLPFFSYGGSSLLIQMAEAGMLLSISRFSYDKE